MPEKLRKQMADMIKAAGQELIDKAEEIVTDPGGVIGYKILIDIRTDTDEMQIPTVNVISSFVSEYALQKKLESYRKEEM